MLDKKRLATVFVTVAMLSAFACDASAEPSKNSQPYFKGTVTEVTKDTYMDFDGYQQPYQELKVKLDDATHQIIDVQNGGQFSITENQRVKKNDVVVITQIQSATGPAYVISDKYRLGSINFMLVIFILMAFLTAGKRGLTSILGLGISVVIILTLIVPGVLSGVNPVAMALLGVLLIAIISLYLAHGFNMDTSLSLVSTLVTLAFSIGFSFFAVAITKLSGGGSEESFFLQANQNIHIDLKGLLLAGMILGILGVLDDVTTAQTSVVFELKRANPDLGLFELYKRGTNVGRQHITSLINTLFLAYAGVSLPLFLLFKINTYQPMWVTLNSEFIVEEVVRTLVGSISLILAVPLSTFIAASYYDRLTAHDMNKLITH